MAREYEIDAGYETVPSPQWVGDRFGAGNTGNPPIHESSRQ